MESRKFDKDSKGRDRVSRLIYYFGDMFTDDKGKTIRYWTKTKMRKKWKDVEKRAKEIEEAKKDVDREAHKIQRNIKGAEKKNRKNRR